MLEPRQAQGLQPGLREANLQLRVGVQLRAELWMGDGQGKAPGSIPATGKELPSGEEGRAGQRAETGLYI